MSEDPTQADAWPMLITVDQLSKMLNVSKRSIYRLVSERRLIEPIHVGKSARWRTDDIRRWIAEGCPPCASVTTRSK